MAEQKTEKDLTHRWPLAGDNDVLPCCGAPAHGNWITTTETDVTCIGAPCPPAVRCPDRALCPGACRVAGNREGNHRLPFNPPGSSTGVGS